MRIFNFVYFSLQLRHKNHLVTTLSDLHLENWDDFTSDHGMNPGSFITLTKI